MAGVAARDSELVLGARLTIQRRSRQYLVQCRLLQLDELKLRPCVETNSQILTIQTLMPIVSSGFRHVQHVRLNRSQPQKGAHRPHSVGQQRNIFWPVTASLWLIATSDIKKFTWCSKTFSGLPNPVSHISESTNSSKIELCTVVTLNSLYVFVH